jgi:hypothetical protein
MRHPEVFLVPLLLLVDYFLTVAGAKLAAGRYNQHFKFEHYELNPLWQKDVAQRKWFNAKHLLIVVVIGFGCYIWADDWQDDSPLSQMALGAALILYSTILATHVANIMTFWRLVRNPDEVKGEITMSHKHLLAVSQYRSFMAIFPVALAAWFSPSPFLYGGIFALVFFNVVQAIWSFNYRPKSTSEAS